MTTYECFITTKTSKFVLDIEAANIEECETAITAAFPAALYFSIES